MSNDSNFRPINGKTQSLSVTAVSAPATIFDVKVPQILFINSGTKTAFIRYTASSSIPTPVALTSDMPLLAGASIIVSCDTSKFYTVAAICGGSDTTTLLITPGYGN